MTDEAADMLQVIDAEWARIPIVERVARTLAVQAGYEPDGIKNGQLAWRSWSDNAKEIVEGLQDPTDAMKRAMAAYPHGDLDLQDGGAGIWNVGIDAALAEGEG